MTKLPSTNTAWFSVTAKSCISTGRCSGTATVRVTRPDASATLKMHSVLPERASVP